MKAMINFKPQKHYIWLLIILITGTFLRLLRLDYQSLWFDELASIVPVNAASTLDSVIEHAKHDQPPAFFLLLYAWFKVFPYTPYSGRLLVAIIGITSIGAIYFLGKEVKDRDTGLCAGGITAINFFHIYYSQELRFYSLLFLLTVLSFLFFIRCIKNQLITHYLLYCCISIALLYTHYYGMVILATQFIIFLCLILFFKKRNTNFIIWSVVSGIIIFLCFVPWLSVVFGDNQIESFWIKTPPVFFPFLYLYAYFGKEPVMFIIGLLLMGLTIRYAITLYRSAVREQEEKEFGMIIFVISAWLLFSYLIPYMYSLLKIPLLHERYTIVTLPSIIVLIATGWNLIPSRNLKTLLMIAILISTCINLAFINPYYIRYHKIQFRELVWQLKDYTSSQTRIYSDQPWYFNFYFDQFNSQIHVIDISEINSASGDMREIKQIWILQVPPLAGAENNSYLQDNFTITKVISYGELHATLYEKNQ